VQAGDPKPRAYDQATVNFFMLPGNTNYLGGALDGQRAEGLLELQRLGLNINGGGPGGKPGVGPQFPTDAFVGGCMGGGPPMKLPAQKA
jgi:hypothetical protein